MNEAVGRGTHYENSERQSRHVLLIFYVPVHRDDSVVFPRRSGQQLAVRNSGPSQADDRIDLMSGQLYGEIDRNVFVK